MNKDIDTSTFTNTIRDLSRNKINNITMVGQFIINV